MSSSTHCSRSALAGEYRGIMNLCRVLPLGLDAKAAVDDAINRCVNCRYAVCVCDPAWCASVAMQCMLASAQVRSSQGASQYPFECVCLCRCGGIGNLRADIHACKQAAEGSGLGEEEGELGPDFTFGNSFQTQRAQAAA